jgi:hypothetical protein
MTGNVLQGHVGGRERSTTQVQDITVPGDLLFAKRSIDKCYTIEKLNIWSLQKFWVDMSNHGTFWEIQDGRQDGRQIIEKWLIRILSDKISSFLYLF